MFKAGKWKNAAVMVVIIILLTGCGAVKPVETGSGLPNSGNEGNGEAADSSLQVDQTEDTTGSSVQEMIADEAVSLSSEEDGDISSEKPEVQDTVSSEVTLVMVGDMLMHTQVNNSGKQQDGSYNYDHLFANVADEIREADLALVNQEVIISGADAGLKGYPRFNGAYELGDSLVSAGFDVILHATNHAMDMGKEGLIRCRTFWNDNYPEIGVVGIYATAEEAEEICIREVNGIKIAILNYTYGTNGIPLPEDMPYAVDLWNEKQITSDVTKAKEMADLVIVCPHWGTEYVLEETSKQRRWAQFLADAGVDLCIGTHPHVIEPMEVIRGETGNEMLVYYSVGNFVNATSGTAEGVSNRMLGAMAKVTVVKDEAGCSISAYEAIPLVAHVEEPFKEKNTVTTYFLDDYTEELASRHYMNRVDPKHFSIAGFYELFEQVFGER